MKGDDKMGSFCKNRIVVIIAVIMLLMLTACDKEADTEISNGDIPDKITILGLGDEDIEVSVDDIKQLKKINKDVISISSSGEENEMNVSGGLMEELLQQYDKSQKDLSGIRVVATDGYSIDIPSEVLKNRDIILAYEVDGEPLFEDSQPIRVVVPDERAMYWIKSLSKIEILTGGENQTNNELVNKIIIFDTALTDLKEEDYEYYESMDKAIKIEELLTEFALDDIDEEIFIKAADGLEKSEANEVFRDAYIKTTGEAVPMFLSPDMPKGMTVKNILWFSIGETSFLSMDNAMENFDITGLDEAQGVTIKDIFNDINLLEGDTYTFTGVDGYSVDIAAEDLDSGILYKMEDGKIAVQFLELEKNATVKDLLSIKVK